MNNIDQNIDQGVSQDVDLDIDQKESYIGSVRFFKHIFLAIIALIIIVPTVISIVLGFRISKFKTVERELRTELESMEAAITKNSSASGLSDEEVAGSEGSERDYIKFSYSELYPDFYAPAAEYSSVNKEKVCYLTFDDGPSERTDEVLTILERENVYATFFVTKQDTGSDRSRLKKTAEAGHTIGMHSAHHDYSSIYTSVEDFLADYYELYTWIKDVTGQAPTIYRFPGGSINGYNRSIYQEIIAEMTRRGFVYFDWNVSSGDAAAAALPATKIKENCLKGIGKVECAVVLMHDSLTKDTTVDALTDIIAGYREAGYTLEGLSPEVTPVIFGYPN